VDIIYDGDDEIILIGDVYELSKGIWIMDELGLKSSLNNSKVEIDNFFQMDHEIRPYELVDSCFSSDRRKDSTQKIFSILVTWVEDVDNIWVRLVNRKQPEFLSKVVTSSMEIHRTQKAFEKMQNQFGPSVESKSLEKMKLTNIYEKKYCVCLRENEYFRALILNVDYRLFKADIKYIDFGDNENVSFNRIYDLHDCYYTMPTNTFACKLKDYEINYGTIAKDDLDKKTLQKNIVLDKLYLDLQEQNTLAKFYRPIDGDTKPEIEIYLAFPGESGRSSVRYSYTDLIAQNILVKTRANL
jgi:hypothetical protein